MDTMKAVVFHGVNDLRIEEVPKPRPRAGEAVIRITATTICGTDVHIVKGEYPVRKGLILGHEPVGVIEELGEGLEDEYQVGQRVIVGAITPCGQCFYCLNAAHSQCGGALGGWRFGNTINGAWAEYLLVPHARANLAVVPDDADRRAGPDAAGHRVDGHLGRRERRRPDRRRRRGLRAGTDRAVRDARRPAAWRLADRRRRSGRGAPGDVAAIRRHAHARSEDRGCRGAS